MLLSRFAALGDLRPFSPAPVLRHRVWVEAARLRVVMLPLSPTMLVGFAVLRIFPGLPSRPWDSPFCSDQKTFQKNPRPAASAAPPPEQKIFRNPTSRKTAVHFCTAVFPYSFGNAFSYSSILRFSSAQYLASSSAMSFRHRFCTTCSPSLLPPARSVVIR